jgi:AcrR family transcriptional regulator
MGRPKASEARDTRAAIMDAALELFAEGGFFGTSMRQIARAVGVRESAIYHYFVTKDALLQALMQEMGTEAAGAVDALFESSRDADLATLFGRFATGALEKFSTLRQKKLFRILMSDGLRLAAEGRFNFMESGGIPRAAAIRLMNQLVQEGRIVASSGEQATLEFIAPLLMWRQLQVFMPTHSWITDYKSFARAHVEHFVRAVRPLDTSSQQSSARSDKVRSRIGRRSSAHSR